MFLQCQWFFNILSPVFFIVIFRFCTFLVVIKTHLLCPSPSFSLILSVFSSYNTFSRLCCIQPAGYSKSQSFHLKKEFPFLRSIRKCVQLLSYTSVKRCHCEPADFTAVPTIHFHNSSQTFMSQLKVCNIPLPISRPSPPKCVSHASLRLIADQQSGCDSLSHCHCVILSLSSSVSRPRTQVLAGLLGRLCNLMTKIPIPCVETVHVCRKWG